MTRKEATELMPIIQAYAEGKEIEIFDKTTKMWKTAMLPHFDCDSNIYRIKPEPKYRPFKDAKECWAEMLKHQPLGWVIKHNEGKILIGEVPSGGIVLHNQRGFMFGFDEANRILTFADGLPFGVKVEG